jgi:HK97 family phage prohead protease
MFQTKDCGLSIKDLDTTKGEVLLYASAFDNVDSDGDIIKKGAFTKTIKENGLEGANRIKHLFQHNVWNIIGKPLSMEQDNKGLLIKSFVSDIKNGDYRKMYEQGLITEHSIGYITVKEASNGSANLISEVILKEYSSVTWGANANTPVVGMKSEQKQDLLEKANARMEKLAKAFRHGSFTDETFEVLEIELKQVQAVYNSLVTHKSETPLIDNEPMRVDYLSNLYKNVS